MQTACIQFGLEAERNPTQPAHTDGPSPSFFAAVLELLATDCLTFIPPQLAAVTSLRSLEFAQGPARGCELTAAALDTLLALPHLASLKLF